MEESGCLNFDLRFTKEGSSYRAEIVESPGGTGQHTFAFPFDERDLEIYLLKIGNRRSGMRSAISAADDAALEFGDKLFRTVFCGELETALEKSLQATRSAGNRLRIRLHLSETPELADLPWEYLYQSPRKMFLARSEYSPVVRYFDTLEKEKPLAVTPPLRMLVMLSNPSDLDPLEVEEEYTNLKKAVKKLEDEKLLAVERLATATLSELQERLQTDTWHIFHFIGHGQFDPVSKQGVLALEDKNGRKKLVSGIDIGSYLSDEPTLRLVVLNACEGARASRLDATSGVAQTLVLQGIIPAVIAMQFEVSEEAALALAGGFYRALAHNYPVDAALSEARKAIHAADCGVEWGTPVLYLRTPDGRIFDVDRTAAPAPVAAKPTPEPSAPPSLTPVVAEPELVVRRANVPVIATTGPTQKGGTRPWVWLALAMAVLFVALIAIGTLIKRQKNQLTEVAHGSPAATSEPQLALSPPEGRSIKDPSSRDNWMESAEYQRAFDARVKAGFFPTQIEGRFNGREEFRATWRRGKSPCNWIAHHGLTNDTSKEFDRKYIAQGFQIIFQSHFTNRGVVKNQVLWAKDCDLVGSWDWSPTEVVTVRPDGPMTSKYNGDGTWTKTGPNTYVMIWDNGFIDTLEISADGQVLKGRNQHHPLDTEPNTYTKRSES